MRHVLLGLALLGALTGKGAALTTPPASSSPRLPASLVPAALSAQGAPEFARASLKGLRLDPDGALRLDGALSGTLESAPVSATFTELLPSWNALTPRGTFVEVEVRAEVAGRWTKYYTFGRWASDADAGRGSVNGQKDADGDVLTDVLLLRASASRYQYRLTLTAERAGTSPAVRLVTFTATNGPAKLPAAAVKSAAWGRTLNVPARSQMVFAAGEGWCSPTSVSMVLAFWGKNVSVPEAAAGTLDRVYQGTGNWAFNAAYAGSLGFTAYATRFAGLADIERHIVAGLPVVLSLGWKEGELPGAPIPKSSGHLIVAVGFDARGNVVVNDPAGKSDAEVRRTYDRAALEKLWLTHSGGTAYVIVPPEGAGKS